MTAGIGVIRSVLIKQRTSGICPSRPPTKNNLYKSIFLLKVSQYNNKKEQHLEEVKITPLAEPIVEKATKTGIIHAIGP